MKRPSLSTQCVVVVMGASLAASGCATVVEGNERAVFFSAASGLKPDPVGPGWHWHLPWDSYEKYDLRWSSHPEQIHIHSQDGLHMNIEVVSVVRPNPKELYALHTDVGPEFYEHAVKPAVFAATRDAAGHFTHLQIATQTHQMEDAIRGALEEHLRGQHVEVAEVAIQHFDLPPEVEEAANKKAASNQLLAAKEVDLGVAKQDAEIEKARRRGKIEAEGMEAKLRADNELQAANQMLELEGMRRKVEREKAAAQAEIARVEAEGEAEATRIRARAEKERVQGFTPTYVRLQAIEALGKAMSSPSAKLLVMPTAKDGLPAFFGPFLNPYSSALDVTGSDAPTAKP